MSLFFGGYLYCSFIGLHNFVSVASTVLCFHLIYSLIFCSFSSISLTSSSLAYFIIVSSSISSFHQLFLSIHFWRVSLSSLQSSYLYSFFIGLLSPFKLFFFIFCLFDTFFSPFLMNLLSSFVLTFSATTPMLSESFLFTICIISFLDSSNQFTSFSQVLINPIFYSVFLGPFIYHLLILLSPFIF